MATIHGHREGLDSDPSWYKNGVIYELHVRAFQDSNGDGVGDFRGLTSRLDYLKDLGVTALWLLPFYQSPLKDDGYDIADYYRVHPVYGTMADFKVFLKEAHLRGLRVITELVLNHTSDQHPWFQRARRSKPGSHWRNYYVWSDTPDRYKGTRIIFKDTETSNWTWDSVAHAYFWHRFFSHQPDLNYDHPEVHEQMIRALDFWLDMGVDGVRLDAVPYLYEREGTACENLPETHAFLRKLRAHVDARYGDRMLLAEANQWPEDAVKYFGQGRGDECHMSFHFPLMPRLFMAVRMEDRLPIVDILEQTPPLPETSQWALFLRNHDDLSLEMVTAEERDYLYRMYAHVHQARLNLGIRRRLAPLMGNDRRRLELLNALLFSLPGTPVLYYGDEIGMGENIYLGDRNGVRTPMQWSSDKNAGFSRANPQSLYLPIIYDPEYHYEAVNAATQLANPHSLLWWMRRILALRKRWRALGEGRCEFLQPENRKILSFLLRHQEETLLVVANLSRFVQPVQLDLTAFSSRVPIELFGRTEFPAITDHPYCLTLGPHAFYWFSIESKAVVRATQKCAPPTLTVSGSWRHIFTEAGRPAFEALLAGYVRHQRWFGGKAKTIKQLTLKEHIPVMGGEDETGCLALLQIDYVQGDTDLYSMPLAYATGTTADHLWQHAPGLVIAELDVAPKGRRGLLYDAIGSPAFCRALLRMIAGRRRAKGCFGEMQAIRTPWLKRIWGKGAPPTPTVGRAEQSNSSIVYGDKFLLKLFRRLDLGINPDLEIGQFLTAREFAHAPVMAGALEYQGPKEERLSLALVNSFIPHSKDTWVFTLDALGRYYDRVTSLRAQGQPIPPASGSLVRLVHQPLPPSIPELVGTYLESARLLGDRTARLHLALASDTDSRAFVPELFTSHYVRGLYQSMRSLTVQNLRLLRRQMRTVPADTRPLAKRVLKCEAQIIQRYRPIIDLRIKAKRTRIHGDYHLGQVLWTGRDFVILDFEGEPALPLSERRLKRSPLRDAAGMVRSFHYASCVGLNQYIERGSLAPQNRHQLEPWARFWNLWVSVVFLKTYFEGMGASDILPKTDIELEALLQAFILQKALYELGYELNNRPSWLSIPLEGILHVIDASITP